MLLETGLSDSRKSAVTVRKTTFKKLKPKIIQFTKYKQLCNNKLRHSHKKRKDSLESSLVRLLFAAELKFPKIFVPEIFMKCT